MPKKQGVIKLYSILKASTLVAVIGFFLFVLISGCDYPLSQKSLDKITVPPEKVDRIEALELPVSADQEQLYDPNVILAPKSPAKEMTLTIEQCRALALRNNLALKVQRFNPMIAKESIIQAQASFEPMALDNISYSKTDSPILSRSNDASQSIGMSNNLRLQFPLRTGGQISVNQPLYRSETDNEYTTLPVSYSSDMSFSLSQPLLRGGGIHTNEHYLRVAHFGSEMTKVRTKLNVITILVSVDIAYWRLYASRRELEVRKLEYDLAVAQRESSQRRFAAGEIIELDVFLSEDAAAQRLEAIILGENSVRDREREMKQVINETGLAVDTPTILISVTEPTPIRYEMDTESLLAMAVENRMELLEHELQIIQADDDIEYVKNSTLPSLSLDYTYNVNALGTTMNSSYDLLWRNRFVDHRIGLNLSVPLGNKSAKSRLRQEILRRQQQLINQEQLKISVKREVLSAVDQMEANWQRVIAGRRSTILAERTLSASQRQYDLGRLILNELLDAQTRYANALSSEMGALVEYQISQLNLALSVGALLSATRVEFETDISNFGSEVDSRQ